MIKFIKKIIKHLKNSLKGRKIVIFWNFLSKSDVKFVLHNIPDFEVKLQNSQFFDTSRDF